MQPAAMQLSSVVILAFLLWVCVVPPSADGAQGFAWVDYYKLRHGRYWMEVREDGEVVYVRLQMPGMAAIAESRRGTLSTTETAQLFSRLESTGFFGMTPQHSSAPGVIDEGDVLTVSACARGRCNRAWAGSPGFVQSGILDFVRALEEKIPALHTQSGQALFLRAVEIDADREARLRARGGSFFSVPDQRLQAHPALREALERPGRFVPLDARELERLADLIPDRRSSFVAASARFHVQVFARVEGSQRP